MVAALGGLKLLDTSQYPRLGPIFRNRLLSATRRSRSSTHCRIFPECGAGSKLEQYSQDDPDAYSISGGLNCTTQGLPEFVEMFKAPIKVLHPPLTTTREGNHIRKACLEPYADYVRAL